MLAREKRSLSSSLELLETYLDKNYPSGTQDLTAMEDWDCVELYRLKRSVLKEKLCIWSHPRTCAPIAKGFA